MVKPSLCLVFMTINRPVTTRFEFFIFGVFVVMTIPRFCTMTIETQCYQVGWAIVSEPFPWNDMMDFKKISFVNSTAFFTCEKKAWHSFKVLILMDIDFWMPPKLGLAMLARNHTVSHVVAFLSVQSALQHG